MTDKLSLPHVAVLLCSYHGEQYLREQLDSIVQQDYGNFSLWVSDDSNDSATWDIVEEYQIKWPDIVSGIRKGPKKGCSTNFLSLLMAGDIKADYFALSDQDDIWYADKLSRAIEALESNTKNQALLYCSRVTLINETGKTIGQSPLFSKPPAFANALVQSIAGGNTMVLNQKAQQAVSQAGITDVVVHDWWLYLLVTGVGGQVVYDSESTLFYRQHEANEIGCDQSISASISRFGRMMLRQHQAWHDMNIQSLKSSEKLLAAESIKLLNQFEQGRKANFIKRFKLFFEMPFYRQTAKGQLSLYISVLLRRL